MQIPFKSFFPDLLLLCLLLSGCGKLPGPDVYTTQTVAENPVPAAISSKAARISPSAMTDFGAETMGAGEPSHENQPDNDSISHLSSSCYGDR
ncbi:MAG: hypothetical protein LLG42_02585 [Chloroflexi bacterium]|nr:hypothetical protein [Chloroflexota bacterium]